MRNSYLLKTYNFHKDQLWNYTFLSIYLYNEILDILINFIYFVSHFELWNRCVIMSSYENVYICDKFLFLFKVLID